MKHESSQHGIQARAVHAPDDVVRSLKREAAEHLAGWQRARADYENLLKRLEAERADASRRATDGLLRELFAIMDYFDAAVAHVPAGLAHDVWTQGIMHTHRALADVLRNAGVTPIRETGMPLDLEQHEPVGDEPSHEPAGTVVRVEAPGYRREGRTLRPARVRVSCGPKRAVPSGVRSRRKHPDPLEHTREGSYTHPLKRNSHAQDPRH